MSSYDPQANYDVIEFEGTKIGEVRKGKYYEGSAHEGDIVGDVFHYQGAPAGKLTGLTITRDDDATLFHLLPQDSKKG
ncbi:hypothetical protein [Pseudomonas sp. Hg5Tf]|uniref:Uncharacterized protein n=1 Tax=Pseudomonas sp. Hg7Tf TaxID=3236988 RepID=A0AB39HWA4_9PSED|nr:hypothetical protein [Pseudomonas sp. Hg5Tf]MDH2562272.1 hypothetical protein [Pseudomonas sp. Hg5Tf]